MCFSIRVRLASDSPQVIANASGKMSCTGSCTCPCIAASHVSHRITFIKTMCLGERAGLMRLVDPSSQDENLSTLCQSRHGNELSIGSLGPSVCLAHQLCPGDTTSTDRSHNLSVTLKAGER